jgi:hypothetical protein
MPDALLPSRARGLTHGYRRSLDEREAAGAPVPGTGVAIDERGELVAASPSVQAYMVVKEAERQRGGPLTPEQIREQGRVMISLGEALLAFGDERERGTHRTPFDLDELEVTPETSRRDG